MNWGEVKLILKELGWFSVSPYNRQYFGDQGDLKIGLFTSMKHPKKELYLVPMCGYYVSEDNTDRGEFWKGEGEVTEELIIKTWAPPNQSLLREV